MGRNVFVSYKYADEKVADLGKGQWNFNNGTPQFLPRRTRVRDYVDDLHNHLKNEEHINLGEKDGESLAAFADEEIETSLKNKIFRSSVTIVMISKGMKEANKVESDQWVPWEISYSLKEITREDRTSRMNAILGLVLPDENDSYDWYYTENAKCNCTTHHTSELFNILKSNMFNIKDPIISDCDGIKISHGESSFIKTVKWSEFKTSATFYIETSVEIRNNKENYIIKKKLT